MHVDEYHDRSTDIRVWNDLMGRYVIEKTMYEEPTCTICGNRIIDHKS